MLEKLKAILPTTEFFYTIGISNKKDVTQYTLLTIALKDDELKIIDRFSSNSLNDSFQERIARNYPILLHIDGDMVISKIVDDKIGYRKNIIFKSNPEEFYFYEYRQSKYVFASVCRKNKVEDYIKNLSNLGFFVIHLAVGPFVMANLLPLLKGESTIASEFDILVLSKNKVDTFHEKEATKKEYLINKEKFRECEVPLLASFFDYKYPNDSIEIEADFLASNASEHRYKKWFKKIGVIALVIILFTLFLSHSLNSHYQKELTLQQFKYNNAKDTENKVNKLKEDVNLKEKILLNNRINNKNFITRYLSDISNSLPETITLLDITVFPMTRKIRSNEKVNFLSNVLNIEGEALEDDSFNLWSKALKELRWVDKMEIIEYKQLNRTNTFKIKIIL